MVVIHPQSGFAHPCEMLRAVADPNDPARAAAAAAAAELVEPDMLIGPARGEPWKR